MPDVEGHHGGTVHISGGAQTDELVVSRLGCRPVDRREPQALGPPNDGGELGEHGGKREVACGPNGDGVKIVIGPKGGVDIAQLNGQCEPSVGVTHRREVRLGERVHRFPKVPSTTASRSRL